MRVGDRRRHDGPGPTGEESRDHGLEMDMETTRSTTLATWPASLCEVDHKEQRREVTRRNCRRPRLTRTTASSNQGRRQGHRGRPNQDHQDD
jgi:hypothetical protein